MKNLLLVLASFALMLPNASLAQGLSKKQMKKMNKASSSLFKGQCPLERIDWMEVSDGYDASTVIALASQLEAAAKADAGKIANIADGSASGKITSDFSKTIDKMSTKKVKVSQDFYQLYLMLRAPVCNIYTSVQTGFYYNNPDALKAAQLAFIDMNKSWLTYAQEEQKKSLH